jgi:hypothetical protein
MNSKIKRRVKMIKRFGFRVVKSEQRNIEIREEITQSTHPYYLETQPINIYFIEVELNTPRYFERAYCAIYYGRYRAKTEIMELEELKNKFPLSYAELDAGEEYIKEFGELK